MASGRGVSLDPWQRQAVLAAAALLRERFGTSPSDTKAKAVHDGLLEVVEPQRRALRLQREMSRASAGNTSGPRSERRQKATERRHGHDRRHVNIGPPMGIERRHGPRRVRSDRRAVS